MTSLYGLGEPSGILTMATLVLTSVWVRVMVLGGATLCRTVTRGWATGASLIVCGFVLVWLGLCFL